MTWGTPTKFCVKLFSWNIDKMQGFDDLFDANRMVEFYTKQRT